MSEQYSFDDFVKNVEKLKSTVERLQENSTNTTEENTIFKIIAPMFLDVLKYPNDVLDREYKLYYGRGEAKRVDLTFIQNDKPIIFIECKSISTDVKALKNETRKQLEGYCEHRDIQDSVRLGIVTNGIYYGFYAKSNKVKPHLLDDNSYFEFNILDKNNDLKELYSYRFENIDNKMINLVSAVNNKKIDDIISQIFDNWYQSNKIDDAICEAIFKFAKENSEYKSYVGNNKDIFFDKVKVGLKQFVDSQAVQFNNKSNTKMLPSNISSGVIDNANKIGNVAKPVIFSDFETKLKSYNFSEEEFKWFLAGREKGVLGKDNSIDDNIMNLYSALKVKTLDMFNGAISHNIHVTLFFRLNGKTVFTLVLQNPQHILLGIHIDFKLLNGIENIELRKIEKSPQERLTEHGFYHGIPLRNLIGFASRHVGKESRNNAVVELKYSSVEQLDDIVALIKQNYDRLSKL